MAGKEKTNNTHGVGRRKSSVARVWLKQGSGAITINGRLVKDYFPTLVTQTTVMSPIRITGHKDSFDIMVNVVGGGIAGQAGAVSLGIARALVAKDVSLRAVLKKEGLLSCDSRVKERKKYGQPGARRKFQFVKR